MTLIRAIRRSDHERQCCRQSAYLTVMLSRVLSGLLPVRVTLAYAVVLVVVATTLLVLGPAAQDRAVSRMSTNLHNLTHGHLGTLLGSAFVTTGAQIYVVLPGLVCLLALAELLWQGRRLVQAFAVGHIGATLVVAAGLGTAIRLGWLPVAVTRASDVGISYGAAAVLGALTAALSARWRPAWIGWWLAIAAAGRGVRRGFHPSRAHGGADAGDAAVYPVALGRALDTAAVGAVGRRRYIWLPVSDRVVSVDGARRRVGRCDDRVGRDVGDAPVAQSANTHRSRCQPSGGPRVGGCKAALALTLGSGPRRGCAGPELAVLVHARTPAVRDSICYLWSSRGGQAHRSQSVAAAGDSLSYAVYYQSNCEGSEGRMLTVIAQYLVQDGHESIVEPLLGKTPGGHTCRARMSRLRGLPRDQ